MLSYVAMLALGLIGIYRLRDALLALQRRRDRANNLSINIIPKDI